MNDKERIAELEAQLEAIHIALTDAGAPEETEAKALDDNPIIERIRLWKYVHDELAAQLAAAKKEIDALTFAAHKPDDYRFGVASWINQRLYRTYIEQGKSRDHWDALTAALDARDAAEARAENASKCLNVAQQQAIDRCKELDTLREQAEADAARLREILRDVWNQFATERPDGTKWAGGLSTLEEVEAALRPDEQPSESENEKH